MIDLEAFQARGWREQPFALLVRNFAVGDHRFHAKAITDFI
jgi:hypothetical protein